MDDMRLLIKVRKWEKERKEGRTASTEREMKKMNKKGRNKEKYRN
jgi:hypothetical protein